MKKLILLIVLLLSTVIHSQSKIDTSAVFFKAKLFTLERKGIFSQSKIYEITKDLKHSYFKSKNFYFIVIKSPKYNYHDDDNKIALFGNCFYYIIYSIKENLFYKVGGFEENNTIEFSKKFRSSIDVTNYSSVVLDKEFKNYLDCIALNKSKKALKYFPRCTDILTDTVILK